MTTTAATASSLLPSPATERELAGILVPRRGQHAIVRGEGCWIWDDEDRRYLDLTASYGVAPLGHAHPALLAAINQQAARLIALSSNFFNDRRAELLGLLRARLPVRFAHFFLCNSGTEANEAALKFAFLVNRRQGWVALKRSFHGRTLGALATTWNPSFRETFAPLLHAATFVDPGDRDALDRAIGDRPPPSSRRWSRARAGCGRSSPRSSSAPRRSAASAAPSSSSTRSRPASVAPGVVRARRARPRPRPDDARQGHGRRFPDRRGRFSARVRERSKRACTAAPSAAGRSSARRRSRPSRRSRRRSAHERARQGRRAARRAAAGARRLEGGARRARPRLDGRRSSCAKVGPSSTA